METNNIQTIALFAERFIDTLEISHEEKEHSKMLIRSRQKEVNVEDKKCEDAYYAHLFCFFVEEALQQLKETIVAKNMKQDVALSKFVYAMH